MKGATSVGLEPAPSSYTEASPQDALDMTCLPQTTCRCNSCGKYRDRAALQLCHLVGGPPDKLHTLPCHLLVHPHCSWAEVSWGTSLGGILCRPVAQTWHTPGILYRSRTKYEMAENEPYKPFRGWCLLLMDCPRYGLLVNCSQFLGIRICHMLQH